MIHMVCCDTRYATVVESMNHTCAPDLYRVTYVTGGLRRRTKTVTVDTLNYMWGAGHLGIRVIRARKATAKEAAKGAYTGVLNA